MDAVTYPQPSVTSFLQNQLVPLRVQFDRQPLSAAFNVQWTPTLITLDAGGKEHHRTLGFLPAEELIASLLLGMAKCNFDAGRFDEALIDLKDILEHYSETDAAPEAAYYRGVDEYKKSSDPKYLKIAYNVLAEKHPDSEWTKRAWPYRLL